MNRRIQLLGIYIVVLSLWQIGLYLTFALKPNEYVWLFYFDPRIGIFFLETGLRGAEEVAPGFVRWLSAVWMFALGLAMLTGRLLKTYMISEVVFMILNLIFFLIIIITNLSPSHGFSIMELFYPALVMVIFSIAPLVFALRTSRRAKQTA